MIILVEIMMDSLANLRYEIAEIKMAIFIWKI